MVFVHVFYMCYVRIRLISWWSGGGIVEFRKDFGHPFAGDYVIDANWQLGFQATTLGGKLRRTTGTNVLC